MRRSRPAYPGRGGAGAPGEARGRGVVVARPARVAPSSEPEWHSAEAAIATEIELKLADPAAMPLLLRHGALRPLRRGRTRTAHVVNIYFDSPDFRLERADVALRSP
jgi:hypothetical protein